MSDVYRKVGRGGAGNYYSKQDIEEATKNANDSQTLPTTSSSTTAPQPSRGPEYLHTGRGGAGNFIQPSSLQSSGLTQTSEDMHSTETSRPAEAPEQRVMGSSKPMYRGGRGGAGNYYDDGEEKRRIEEEREYEEKRMRELQGRVEVDVERGLRRPEKAYAGEKGE
ncbi:uncharacterized protein RAG0_09386 [Rhynchosporium agropyri]|uniref:Uncharacterized protein n=1 Tax=Rhynchosporium agropyri TaxID=914238 RepID=A0A1E1KVA8_9HELO|nr:uncharacterized protein RAG0_09386 [Rhynchosporium agropyri]